MDDEKNIALASLKLYLEMNYPSFERTRRSRNPPYRLYERKQPLRFMQIQALGAQLLF
jgi:hypothetical protein